jgi:tRNA uridine 5-carboxymethylaminomethyl modification enzyme
MLEQTENLDFWQDMMTELIIEEGKCVGVRTQIGVEFRSKAVVLTNGTFLNGLIHIGEKQFGGGRAGARASTGITEQLMSLGFESGRMKTGTPPRVDGRSIDYTKLEEQPGDENPSTFSFKANHKLTKQRSCYIGYTNQNVHDILQTGFEKSPMFAGRIQGLGPRYCPSIEDKIVRFSERDRHQLFVEPEGWDTCEIYLNGFSTSLPEDVQQSAMQLIPGFENAKMFRPGYAIEYDFFQPTQLKNTLETKMLPGLYFAGQINGTTGYEEAGGQGLMAGINAHLKINDKDPFVLNRDQAYIGVLIDDLVTKGTTEPYRMFTSRAEYRILLRQDNADIRLTKLSYDLGLATADRLKAVELKSDNIDKIIQGFAKTSLDPSEVNPYLEKEKSSPLKQKVKANTVVTRPNITVLGLKDSSAKLSDVLDNFDELEIENAEILMKYEGYIKREKEVADKLMRLENIKIYKDIDYSKLSSLSSEAVDKLSKVQPTTIGQASRISGISPSDVSVLMVFHGR